MSSLGFFIERDYAATHALRRPRNGLASVAQDKPGQLARAPRRTSANFYLALAVPLILAALYASPELHKIAALF